MRGEGGVAGEGRLVGECKVVLPEVVSVSWQ